MFMRRHTPMTFTIGLLEKQKQHGQGMDENVENLVSNTQRGSGSIHFDETNAPQHHMVQDGGCHYHMMGSGYSQSGRGFIDQVHSLIGSKRGMEIGKGSNPNWRPGFAGERHIAVPTPYGPTRGNYIGPGTHLDERLERDQTQFQRGGRIAGTDEIQQMLHSGDPPADGIFDKYAKIHDYEYKIADTMDEVVRADDNFLKGVEQGKAKHPKLTKLVQGAIKAKMLGEKILKKPIITPNERFNEDTMQGSGLFEIEQKAPVANLKAKLMKNIRMQKTRALTKGALKKKLKT